MIIIQKGKLPKIVYRKKPWKIALMVLIPSLVVASLVIGTSVLVTEINKRKIISTFSIEKVSNEIKAEYRNKTIPELSEDDIRNILVQQFYNNQKYHIITPQNNIPINISKDGSNAVEGLIKFSSTFTISNNDIVKNDFTITGFKKQPRPNYLSNVITLTDTELNNVYPSTLITNYDNDVDFDQSNSDVALLKTYLYNNLPNKPSNLSIDDFEIQVQNINNSYSSWDGHILVNYYLNKTKYKYPEYSSNVRINGFKQYQLTTLTQTDGYYQIAAPKNYNQKQASDITKADLKSIIVNYLISTDQSIPLDVEDIDISISKVDDDNGRVFLSSLRINRYFPIKIYNNVIVSDFNVSRPYLKTSNIALTNEYIQWTAKEISISNLQKIVFDNLIIPSNLNLTASNIILTNLERNEVIGKVSFTASIKNYVVQPFEQKITISNFKIYRPDALDKASYTVSSNYSSFLPSSLSDDKLKVIIYNFMTAIPNDLRSSDLNIITRQNDDSIGKITVSGNIPKYNERNPYNFSIVITGFKNLNYL